MDHDTIIAIVVLTVLFTGILLMCCCAYYAERIVYENTVITQSNDNREIPVYYSQVKTDDL